MWKQKNGNNEYNSLLRIVFHALAKDPSTQRTGNGFERLGCLDMIGQHSKRVISVRCYFRHDYRSSSSYYRVGPLVSSSLAQQSRFHDVFVSKVKHSMRIMSPCFAPFSHTCFPIQVSDTRSKPRVCNAMVRTRKTFEDAEDLTGVLQSRMEREAFIATFIF